MLRFLLRFSLTVACSALLSVSASAQMTSKATLETSEALFSVLTALNACGYDQGLSVSEPVRTQVREEVARAAQASEPARAATEAICTFYRDHQVADPSQNVAQYLSLALNLSEPPVFTPSIKEADMPPDTGYVLGFIPLLKRFHESTGLHEIWLRHKAEYDGLIDQFHSHIANMLLTTDVYLKIPVSGYLGRQMLIFLEPMSAPGQVNSRNYGANYYLIVSPERGNLRIETIRHTYLHFTLDPLVAKRGSTMKRLAPLLESVKTAPMAEHFKEDITLLVTESLIRAVEARTAVRGKTKQAEQERARLAQKAAEEGFILAPYFEQHLAAFENTPDGLQDAFPEWLYALDVPTEKKRAAGIVFANVATPESLQSAAQSRRVPLLQEAEQRFAAGDIRRAQGLAQQALEQKQEEGRALFLLAQIAAQNKDINNAQAYFERAIKLASEPRQIAWSHIYLGRIFDLKAERESAIAHYRAALAAGDTNPATRAAAERGLQQPYAPPGARQEEPSNE